MPSTSITTKLDPYQAANNPSTQIYRTSYGAAFLPTTKVDHDRNNRSINDLRTLPKQVQRNNKCKPSLKGSDCQTNTAHGHHRITGTQRHAATYNDPPSAPTSHLASASHNLTNPQPIRHIHRQITSKSKKNVAITVLGRYYNQELPAITTTQTARDPSDEAQKTPHTKWPTLNNQIPQSTPHTICLPSLSIRALSQKYSDTNDRLLVMIEKLQQIDTYLRTEQPFHHPLSPTATTVSNNTKPSQHPFSPSEHHNDNPDPKVDPTTDPTTNSTTSHWAATTTTSDLISSKLKAPSTIPEICSAIILTNVSTPTTTTATAPNPFPNNTAPQDLATDHEHRDPTDNPRIKDHPATITFIHNNYKPAPPRPSFAHWCQQHAMLKSKIHRSVKHTMAAALFRRKIPSKHHHENSTINHAEFDKHLSHESTILSRTPSTNTSSINHHILVLLATHIKHPPATTQSRETSTLRRHHVRFQTSSTTDYTHRHVHATPQYTNYHLTPRILCNHYEYQNQISNLVCAKDLLRPP